MLRIKKLIKQKPHIFANTLYCWQQYIKHTHCQLVFQIAGFYSKKNIGCTLKLLISFSGTPGKECENLYS